ncbi:hypothetical protein [Anaerotignum lactatifermentans]|uniref:hypothetical protein n=1 Tax=Anaerotignum lactatifermentans TaxID=160404 RepID=UPI00174C56C3|nr:hypothetical protein [Anaerotignum lactatifermentans]
MKKVADIFANYQITEHGKILGIGSYGHGKSCEARKYKRKEMEDMKDAPIYDLHNPPYEKCPHCGSLEFYTRQRVNGVIQVNFRFDGQEADNESMYEALEYKEVSEYAYCSGCGKRLFRFCKKL